MTTQDMAHVPERSHYAQRYFKGGRVFSYAHQLDTVLSFEPKHVLEIGVGAGVVAAALGATGVEVATVDIQRSLRPDIVASVTALPVPDRAYDVVVCCQVLEHLPFSNFDVALRELARVAAMGVVLSLPDSRPHHSLSWTLPKIGQGRWSWSRGKRPSQARMQSGWVNAGHYWEIGWPGYSLATILASIEACGLNVHREWRVPEIAWHHFFELRSGN